MTSIGAGGPAGTTAGWTLAGMGTTAWVLAAVAALAALADWVAVSGARPALARLEYAAKPTVLAALLGAAATLTSPDPSRQDWFIGALACCLVGDVVLMLPGGRTAAFGGGLAAFLVAQICFIVGLTSHGLDGPATLLALSVLVVVTAVPGGRVLGALARSDQPWLIGPLVVYMGALLLMAAAASASGILGRPFGTNGLVVAGALLFVLSDTLLATDRFVGPIRRATLWVHSTYHLAVALLVLSLAGRPATVRLSRRPGSTTGRRGADLDRHPEAGRHRLGGEDRRQRTGRHQPAPRSRAAWVMPGGISSAWWVTSTRGGIAGSPASAPSEPSRRSRAPRSRPAAGSSSSSSSGRPIRARASRTRCRSPSEMTPKARSPMGRSPARPPVGRAGGRPTEAVGLRPLVLGVGVPPRLEGPGASGHHDLSGGQLGA